MTGFSVDESSGQPVEEHPDPRSPDVERPGPDPATDDADQDVEGLPDVEHDGPVEGDGDPNPGSESPGETIDDPVVAEPNEPA